MTVVYLVWANVATQQIGSRIIKRNAEYQRRYADHFCNESVWMIPGTVTD